MTVIAMNRKTGKSVTYDARNIMSYGSGKLSIALLDHNDNDRLVTVTIPLKTHVVSIDP